MLETLFGVLGVGGYATGKFVSNSVKEQENKEKAIASGEAYYWDSNGKIRSVETNEICITQNLPSAHYHRVLVGVNSNRIYKDYTLENAQKANEELKKNGQKWIYKETEDYSNGSYKWKPYDPEKQMFFYVKWKHNFINNRDTNTVGSETIYEITFHKDGQYRDYGEYLKLKNEEGNPYKLAGGNGFCRTF